MMINMSKSSEMTSRASVVSVGIATPEPARKRVAGDEFEANKFFIVMFALL